MLLFPAFAALTPGALAPTVETYRDWLKRVAQHEFADELVASCVARHLRVILTLVPYSPPSASRAWCIVEYPSAQMRADLGIEEASRVVLGNNDVHYVWLVPAVVGDVRF